MTRIVYLGASGSFSEQAALALAERRALVDATFAGARDPAAVVAALIDGEAELGVLPVANTSGGLVRETLAALGGGIELVDELALPVRFTLWLARPGIELASIERVASHPQAFAQCARTLERLLPGCARLAQGDTASAARALSEGGLDERTAVLASARAGRRYGLFSAAEDVHDDPANRTFFALFRRRFSRPRVD